MQTDKLLALARKHVYRGEMSSSAMLCLSDAITLRDAGKLGAAHKRALDSLRYSCGVFHADYKRALGV